MLAVQIVWTPELKAIAAKLERRTDRALPYPRRIARAAHRALRTAKVILLPDLTQGELFPR